MGVFGSTKLKSKLSCLPTLKQNGADKWGICCDLQEGPWLFHNYADLLPAATSGHVLTDIPKLLNDAVRRLSSLPFGVFFLVITVLRKHIETFQWLMLWKNFFFSDNSSTIGVFNIFYASSWLNKITFSHRSAFGCIASNLSKYRTKQLHVCCVMLHLSGLFPTIISTAKKDYKYVPLLIFSCFCPYIFP